jgi:DNA-binding Lrp family transcriptional regulator
MLIEVEGRSADKVISSLTSLAAITAIHTTNGKWDLIAELAADSLSSLDGILRGIRMIPGITASETNLLLATPRTTRART